MNANDLADRLEQFYTGTHIQKAAETLRQQEVEIERIASKHEEMLRQQQAEIEALKHWQETWRPFLKEHFGINK